jgi:hypothetical protein
MKNRTKRDLKEAMREHDTEEVWENKPAVKEKPADEFSKPCGRKCPHGSPCILDSKHDPGDGHVSKDSCWFYDKDRCAVCGHSDHPHMECMTRVGAYKCGCTECPTERTK